MYCRISQTRLYIVDVLLQSKSSAYRFAEPDVSVPADGRNVQVWSRVPPTAGSRLPLRPESTVETLVPERHQILGRRHKAVQPQAQDHRHGDVSEYDLDSEDASSERDATGVANHTTKKARKKTYVC